MQSPGANNQVGSVTAISSVGSASSSQGDMDGRRGTFQDDTRLRAAVRLYSTLEGVGNGMGAD